MDQKLDDDLIGIIFPDTLGFRVRYTHMHDY